VRENDAGVVRGNADHDTTRDGWLHEQHKAN
jgi:hypothetical protein